MQKKKMGPLSRIWLGLSLLLAMALAAPAMAFSDLGGVSLEAQQAINELAELGVLNGYIDDTFRPDNSISRAEFAKMISQTLSQRTGVTPTAKQQANFVDVSPNAWFAKDVDRVAALGLMKGDAEGTFRPNDSISIGEVITVLMRALGYADADLKLTDKAVIASIMQGTNRTEAEVQALPWPDNYIAKGIEIGLVDEDGVNSKSLCSRAMTATYTARMLHLPLLAEAEQPAETVKNPVQQEYLYGVVTARSGETLTITRFSDGLKQTYHIGGNCDWQIVRTACNPGMIIAYRVSNAGSIVYVGLNGVQTHNQREAELAGSKIKLNGKSLLLANDVSVLLMNSAGGVTGVSLERLQASDYVADLRSSDYRADVQYVLNQAGEVACLLIGDYRGMGKQMFGYIESFGNGQDGLMVNFFGDGTEYVWKYVGKEGYKAPEEGKLYAYRFRADSVEAYEVDFTAEQIHGVYGEGEIVQYAGDICLTESGKQFIVDSETQIMRVSYRSDGTIYKVTAEDTVYGGDRVRVRYTEKSGSNYTGLEAAYVLIIDTI